jgi:N-acetylglutamate synthase-like GNAT family acetyltransferase
MNETRDIRRSFALRAATRADSSAIKSLIHTVGINPIGLDWMRFVIAVKPEGELVGCGQLKPHRDGSHELASIAVIREMRGKGVAQAIIERLLAEHTGDLYLTCRASLGPFYRKFGFRTVEVAEIPPYFRTVMRFANLIQRLGIMEEGLLVMKREE